MITFPISFWKSASVTPSLTANFTIDDRSPATLNDSATCTWAGEGTPTSYTWYERYAIPGRAWTELTETSDTLTKTWGNGYYCYDVKLTVEDANGETASFLFNRAIRPGRIKIDSWTEFKKIGRTYSRTADYMQVADIEVPESEKDYVPTYFQGQYEGGYHTITGLEQTTGYEGQTGIFYNSSGSGGNTFEGLFVHGCKFKGSGSRNGAFSGVSLYSKIYYCGSINNEIIGSSSSAYNGGFIGKWDCDNGSGTIAYCLSANNTMSTYGTSGGVCGFVEETGSKSATIADSFSINNSNPDYALAFVTSAISSSWSRNFFNGSKVDTNYTSTLKKRYCYYDKTQYTGSVYGLYKPTGLTTAETKDKTKYTDSGWGASCQYTSEAEAYGAVGAHELIDDEGLLDDGSKILGGVPFPSNMLDMLLKLQVGE